MNRVIQHTYTPVLDLFRDCLAATMTRADLALLALAVLVIALIYRRVAQWDKEHGL